MNKTFKIFIAILGGINIIFSIFIPISISLILVNMYHINWFSFFVLVLAGSLSSLYRAMDVGLLDYFIEKYSNNGRRKKHSR